MATSDSPLSVPDVTLAVARGAAGGGTFTPMIAENFLSGVSGQRAETAGTQWHWRSLYDQTRAFSGSQSMKVSMLSSDGETCGGSHSYGGKITLPEFIPEGKSIWVRFKMYIPSSFSWGYVYGAPGDDSAAAAACGQDADGYGRHKFIVFDPDDASGRLYFSPWGYRRDVKSRRGLNVDTDIGASGELDASFLLPFDQWFDLQVKIYVHSVSGIYRIWINGKLAGELPGKTIKTETAKIASFGIGDYWNGVHYTDGAPGRSDFWVDDIIVATDLDGYGSPTGEDESGNAIIKTDALVEDFA